MRFLFQGDSITDTGRLNHEDPHDLGCGYVLLLGAELACFHPENEILNMGILSNRVLHLLARWKKDCLNLRPDVLTVLGGVNDGGHWYGVKPALFEEVYNILLRETREKLPDTRILLMGSYCMHGTATEGVWDLVSEGTAVRREITEKLAKRYGTDYVDLQEEFDRALQKLPPTHWTIDGVHPTPAGHRLIAQAWKRAYGWREKEDGQI